LLARSHTSHPSVQPGKVCRDGQVDRQVVKDMQLAGAPGMASIYVDELKPCASVPCNPKASSDPLLCPVYQSSLCCFPPTHQLPDLSDSTLASFSPAMGWTDSALLGCLCSSSNDKERASSGMHRSSISCVLASLECLSSSLLSTFKCYGSFVRRQQR
jgi:hypothetical protein